jgi:hypothetical protein
VAIQLGLGLITQAFFVVMAFRQKGALPVSMRMLQQLVAFFTNTFVGPIYATGFTLFYYDQRVRKEGYDIERMMKAAGLTETPPPPIAEVKEVIEGRPERAPVVGIADLGRTNE